MNTTTQTKCDGCAETHQSDNLTFRKWIHNDPYEKHGWAYYENDNVSGNYCTECIDSIDELRRDYQMFLSENDGMSADDWQDLALKLAYAYKRSVTNWQDNLTAKEKFALAQEMRD